MGSLSQNRRHEVSALLHKETQAVTVSDPAMQLFTLHKKQQLEKAASRHKPVTEKKQESVPKTRNENSQQSLLHFFPLFSTSQLLSHET
jgi:hypothetical protein